jgi:FMN phosphatase YigB (HAD superfamily)
MKDLDIKNKRILLFDFDGTLIETASGNTFATDLTDMRIKMDVLNIRIDKDQNFNSYSDVIKIETLKDGSIKYTSLYHESKENGDSLS